MNKIYIGWDSREDIAYTVAAHSMELMSRDVSIQPLKQHELREEGIYTRSVDKLGSTEFTFTRFLVPYMNDYNGWALFTDCDVLALDDMNKLFELADDKYAVMCVKHDYTPSETVKMDGQQQSIYPRKNWSSVVLWNCAHPSNSVVTPELVNTESGMYMHRFMWLKDEEIGEIPYQWNYLSDWYQTNDPKLVHFTEGGPWFEEYSNCEYSKEWKDILCLKYDLINHVKDRITEY
jgi:lipopolysaccharide biosynthesis glycosyltransferase